MNRIKSALLSIAAALLALTGASAQVGECEAPSKPSSHVSDRASSMSEPDRNRLEAKLSELEESTGMDFVVLTVDRLDCDIDRFATRVFNRWSIGDPVRNDGVLIVNDVSRRKYAVHIRVRLDDMLTDNKVVELNKAYLIPLLKHGKSVDTYISLSEELSDYVLDARARMRASSTDSSSHAFISKIIKSAKPIDTRQQNGTGLRNAHFYMSVSFYLTRLLALLVFALAVYHVVRTLMRRRARKLELEVARTASLGASGAVAAAAAFVRQTLAGQSLKSWQTAAAAAAENSRKCVESAESMAEMSRNAVASADAAGAKELAVKALEFSESAEKYLREYEAQVAQDAEAVVKLSDSLDKASQYLTHITKSVLDQMEADGYRVDGLREALPKTMADLPDSPYEAAGLLAKKVQAIEHVARDGSDRQKMREDTDKRIATCRKLLPELSGTVTATTDFIKTIVSEFGKVNAVGLSAKDDTDSIKILLDESTKLNSMNVQDFTAARRWLKHAEQQIGKMRKQLSEAESRLKEVRKIRSDAARQLKKAEESVSSARRAAEADDVSGSVRERALALSGLLSNVSNQLAGTQVDWLALEKSLASLHHEAISTEDRAKRDVADAERRRREERERKERREREEREARERRAREDEESRRRASSYSSFDSYSSYSSYSSSSSYGSGGGYSSGGGDSGSY